MRRVHYTEPLFILLTYTNIPDSWLPKKHQRNDYDPLTRQHLYKPVDAHA